MKDWNREAQEASAEFAERRIVSLAGPISDESATQLIAELLFLEHESKDRPILLLIDSPGGSVSPAMAISDVIRGHVAERTRLTPNQAKQLGLVHLVKEPYSEALKSAARADTGQGS